MTNRELLELAAKAAGIHIIGPIEKWIVQPNKEHEGGYLIRNNQGGDSAWNPLKDDGDALRLAARLTLNISFDRQTAAPAVSCSFNGLPGVPYQHNEDRDVQGADEILIRLRRAIVRVAAEVGKTMP
jgi:hypothetical protein